MSALDSKAAFLERLKQLGVEDEFRDKLRVKGFETYGSLAFAVSTTPQQITDNVLDEWLKKMTAREISAYQLSCDAGKWWNLMPLHSMTCNARSTSHQIRS